MEKVISSKIVYECPIFKVQELDVELPSGKRTKRWHLLVRDSVAVVPVDGDGRILLTREYRSAANEVVWRIPAGTVGEGERPEEAAHREMREEIGLDCRDLEFLFKAKDPSSLKKQLQHYFLARKLFPSPLTVDEGEQIEIIPKTPKEVLELIYTGNFQTNMLKALLKAVEIISPAKV